MESMDGFLLPLPTTATPALWRLRQCGRRAGHLASIDMVGGMRRVYRRACALLSTPAVSAMEIRQRGRCAGIPLRSG